MLVIDTMHSPKYHINNRQSLPQLTFFLVHYDNMPSNLLGPNDLEGRGHRVLE